jgi:cytohesin
MIIKTLLEQNTIDIACQDAHGFSPLNHAASQNSLCAVIMLLNKGANMNTANRRWLTPLNWAVEHGNTAMVDVLLNTLSSKPPLAVSESHEIERSNSRSLHIAAGARKLDILQRLLDHGYDVNTRGSEQETPLSLAVKKGYMEVVSLLLRQQNIDINAGIGGITPIWLATRYGRDDVARRLLTIPDLDVNAAATESRVGGGLQISTPLHQAVKRGHTLIARLLVANGLLDPNISDHRRRTPLHWAAGNGNLGMVDILLSRQDVLLNAEDIDGSTPLMLAVIRDHMDVAKRLARVSRHYRQM